VAERVFEELRRRVEGRTYATLADKRAIADAYLRELAADPTRVKHLGGWDWLVAALAALPAASPPCLRRNGISASPCRYAPSFAPTFRAACQDREPPKR
jgi:hypothetical protein